MRAPKLCPVRRIDQIGLHADLVAVLRNASHQHRSDLKLFPDFLRVILIALEAEDAASRHHFEIGQLRQRADQALGQAVAQIFIVRIRRRIHERQHRERVNLLSL